MYAYRLNIIINNGRDMRPIAFYIVLLKMLIERYSGVAFDTNKLSISLPIQQNRLNYATISQNGLF